MTVLATNFIYSIFRWRQLEELQSKEKASTSKRNKQKLDDFTETDDNSNLEPCKEEMESDDYKSDDDSEEENETEESVKNEANEEVKEELEDNIESNYPNIKMEEEEDDDDVENITNYQDDQEHRWHHDEDDDDTTDGDKNSQEVLVKPDFSDDVPAVRPRCESRVVQKSVQPKVKKEEKEGKSNECSLCTDCLLYTSDAADE